MIQLAKVAVEAVCEFSTVFVGILGAMHITSGPSSSRKIKIKFKLLGFSTHKTITQRTGEGQEREGENNSTHSVAQVQVEAGRLQPSLAGPASIHLLLHLLLCCCKGGESVETLVEYQSTIVFSIWGHPLPTAVTPPPPPPPSLGIRVQGLLPLHSVSNRPCLTIAV